MNRFERVAAMFSRSPRRFELSFVRPSLDARHSDTKGARDFRTRPETVIHSVKDYLIQIGCAL
jgi:hypothetical protein